MKNPIDRESEDKRSGLFIGSEPLDGVRGRSAASGADDDKSDTRDTDALDGADSDGADSDGTDGGADSDGTDTDGTDGKD